MNKLVLMDDAQKIILLGFANNCRGANVDNIHELYLREYQCCVQSIERSDGQSVFGLVPFELIEALPPLAE